LGGGGLLTGGGGGLLTGGGGERLGGGGRGGGGFLGGGEGGLNTDLICQTVSAPAWVWVHMSVSMLLQSVLMHRYCRAHPDRACSTQQQEAGNSSAAAVSGRAGICACHASGVAVWGVSRSRGLSAIRSIPPHPAPRLHVCLHTETATSTLACMRRR
jgi:hypothetical protein